MRIEIVKLEGTYEKVRWEFHCVLDSRGLHIKLVSMTKETRESTNRGGYKLHSRWDAFKEKANQLPESQRISFEPLVPLDVQRDMRRNLEAAISYDFGVCMPKTEAPSKVTHH